jgi:hypothetical protein
MKKESLAVFMHKALQVGKEYTVFSTIGNTFSGVYKGLIYEMLLFEDAEGNRIYFNPSNIEMIMEKNGGKEL